MNRTAVVAAILRGDRCFLQRRDLQSTRLPGLWEFPGGKVEAGESEVDALRRELREEVAWEPTTLSKVMTVTGPQGPLVLFCAKGPGPVSAPLAWGWFALNELPRLPIPTANLALLEGLKAFLADPRSQGW